jgi:autotransporter passenger strand-loop-strand repeat protein
VVPAGVEKVAGIASGTTVLGYIVTGPVLGGDGTQIVSSGGTAFATTLSSGGSQVVRSGGLASGAALIRGGSQIISAGGSAVSTTLSAIVSTINGYTINAVQSIGSGGTATTTTRRSASAVYELRAATQQGRAERDAVDVLESVVDRRADGRAAGKDFLEPLVNGARDSAAGIDILHAAARDRGRARLPAAADVLDSADRRADGSTVDTLHAGRADRGVGGAATGKDELNAVVDRAGRLAARRHELPAAAVDRGVASAAAVLDGLFAAGADRDIERRAQDALGLPQCHGRIGSRRDRGGAHDIDRCGKRKSRMCENPDGNRNNVERYART